MWDITKVFCLTLPVPYAPGNHLTIPSLTQISAFLIPVYQFLTDCFTVNLGTLSIGAGIVCTTIGFVNHLFNHDILEKICASQCCFVSVLSLCLLLHSIPTNFHAADGGVGFRTVSVNLTMLTLTLLASLNHSQHSWVQLQQTILDEQNMCPSFVNWIFPYPLFSLVVLFHFHTMYERPVMISIVCKNATSSFVNLLKWLPTMLLDGHWWFYFYPNIF